MYLAMRNTFGLAAFCSILLAVSCADTGIREGSIGSRGTGAWKSGVGARPDDGEKPADFSRKKMTDRGDFLVEHRVARGSKFEEIAGSLRKDNVLENVAEKLNGSFKLPGDIVLRAKICGDVNASYSPKDRSITFCYELIEHFLALFKLDGDSDERATDRTNKAITFAVLHEVGHAMIDSYDLPVTGNEEDVADKCSAFICLRELGDDGVGTLVAAAEAFAIESAYRKPVDRRIAREHLLNEQRFLNSLCMIYGSDPKKYGRLKGSNLLPEARAARCAAEHDRIAKSWENLLRPWRKD